MSLPPHGRYRSYTGCCREIGGAETGVPAFVESPPMRACGGFYSHARNAKGAVFIHTPVAWRLGYIVAGSGNTGERHQHVFGGRAATSWDTIGRPKFLRLPDGDANALLGNIGANPKYTVIGVI